MCQVAKAIKFVKIGQLIAKMVSSEQQNVSLPFTIMRG